MHVYRREVKLIVGGDEEHVGRGKTYDCHAGGCAGYRLQLVLSDKIAFVGCARQLIAYVVY